MLYFQSLPIMVIMSNQDRLEWHYPRGLTSLGIIYAMLRLRINNKEKRIYINPIRNTMEIPLTMFADWENLKVPKVIVKQCNIIIQNEELLRGWKVIY